MSNLYDSLFQLKITSKTLTRQAQKVEKESKAEQEKIKKALREGFTNIARIHAENAIRKQEERVNLLRLASKIDAVSSRVQTAVTMRGTVKNMGGVVNSLDKAMQTMNLESVASIMEKFESQFEDIDVQSSFMENAMSQTTAQTQPQDKVENLLQMIADATGIERSQQLEQAVPKGIDLEANDAIKDQDEQLHERLRAIRQEE